MKQLFANYIVEIFLSTLQRIVYRGSPKVGRVRSVHKLTRSTFHLFDLIRKIFTKVIRLRIFLRELKYIFYCTNITSSISSDDKSQKWFRFFLTPKSGRALSIQNAWNKEERYCTSFSKIAIREKKNKNVLHEGFRITVSRLYLCLVYSICTIVVYFIFSVPEGITQNQRTHSIRASHLNIRKYFHKLFHNKFV